MTTMGEVVAVTALVALTAAISALVRRLRE